MVPKPKVSLFIPCLVDQVYPEIGIDTAKILKHLGYPLDYNHQQTCCGQPAFNAGHREEARKVATKFVDVFSSSDVVVSPSGSCTAMVRNYYPTLFDNDPHSEKAVHLGNRVYELSEFLVHEDQVKNIFGDFTGKVGFHNSCHSYHELGIDQFPLSILQMIKGIDIVQPTGETVCCGFGGLFSFKFDEIASTMAKTRIEMFTSLNADTIVTNDPGCLMHMRQEVIDRNYNIKILHLSEFLVQALKL
jgi:L-lactate dehydrogenase complex protein LldE